MSRILSLTKEIEAFRAQTDIAKELAEPYQELVNLVHANKIERFTMTMHKVQKVGQNPYSVVKFTVHQNGSYAATIGLSSIGNLADVKECISDKNLLDKETVKKILSLDKSVSMLNSLVGDMIPPSNDMYPFSLSRLNGEAGFDNEKTRSEWPMLPKYMESLVNLNGSAEKKKNKDEKFKP